MNCLNVHNARSKNRTKTALSSNILLNSLPERCRRGRGHGAAVRVRLYAVHSQDRGSSSIRGFWLLENKSKCGSDYRGTRISKVLRFIIMTSDDYLFLDCKFRLTQSKEDQPLPGSRSGILNEKPSQPSSQPSTTSHSGRCFLINSMISGPETCT